MKVKTYVLATILACVIMFSACQQAGFNKTGSEYMPDMAHSVAYEANYYNYYYNNTWGSEDEYYELAKPRHPVAGTVPYNASGAKNPAYAYGNSDKERDRAMAEVIDNPYKITDAGIATGKELYNTFCAVCHGEKADGAGYLVREDGGKYPVQPANFLLDEFIDASNGRYYHSIIHGRNLMGAYKDKLNYEERWQVIHYIRSLQAKEKSLVYNQTTNTLNSVEEPAGVIVAQATHSADADMGGHSHDADHGGGRVKIQVMGMNMMGTMMGMGMIMMVNITMDMSMIRKENTSINRSLRKTLN